MKQKYHYIPPQHIFRDDHAAFEYANHLNANVVGQGAQGHHTWKYVAHKAPYYVYADLYVEWVITRYAYTADKPEWTDTGLVEAPELHNGKQMRKL